MKYSNETYQEAIAIFGKDVVYTVIEVVEVSDPDGAYSMFEDMGKYNEAECVEFLYFN
jgi:hypothetical protein